MAKRIVYCSDGTWQVPAGRSNVYRIFNALMSGPEQKPLYSDGIGADATGLKHLLDGALGEGLLDKVREAYTAIASIYERGDSLYLFGFSRGAYTVRSLAGMLQACGIPAGPPTEQCVSTALAAYRDPAGRAALLASIKDCSLEPPEVCMIGVWDTVGALGIPAILGGIEKQYGFLDTALNSHIHSGYQCLGVDEKRPQFPATLWTPPFSAGQIVEQVWFAGCHGDVGGATPAGGLIDDGSRLCDITLGWMMRKAQEMGLIFTPEAQGLLAELPQHNALDAFHETLTPGDPIHLRPIAADSTLADSVSVRVLADANYRPGNLLFEADSLVDTYCIEPVVNTDEL